MGAIENMETIHFRESDHTYWLGSVRIPGVTSVIDGLLKDFSKVPGPILEAARELGTLVHDATALDAAGVLDEDSVDDDVKPYLAAWRKFMAETGAHVISTEEIVFHPQYRYAGKLDHRVMLFGVHTLIDKKTGVPDDADAVQTAAYAEAYNVGKATPDRVRKRAALYLGDNGKYRLKYHDDRSDFSTFLATLNIYERKHRV